MQTMEFLRNRIEERIERIPMSGCWIWTSTVNQANYGVFGIRKNGRSVPTRAHRLSYEAFVGPIPPGLFVLHRCDVRECVNPHHLFVGTQKDNIHDMISKGRSKMTSTSNSIKTHCKNGHEFTPENTMTRAWQGGSRQCRKCWAATQSAYRERIRGGKNGNDS